MTPMRAVVADDERLARQKIRQFAAGHEWLEVVAEAANGLEAVEAIRVYRPDLLFLDVRMPGLDGFEVLRRLEPAIVPLVIFTTAHDEFALDAFDAEAIDYLLKPFDRKRFDRAVNRARRRGAAPHDAAGLLAALSRVSGGLHRAAPSREPVTRFMVTSRGRMLFVQAADVRWITAEGKYVRLHVAGGSHLLRHSLQGLEARLDPGRFLRIHRSTIVNVREVREIHRGVGDEFVVVLRDGSQLPLSRRYRSKLEPLC